MSIHTVAVAFAAIAAVAGASESFYAVMENRLPATGMQLTCRVVGAVFVTGLSVVPRGRGEAGRRVTELTVEDGRDGRVRCTWSYAGNYATGLTLLDSQWAEARSCQDPSGSGGLCHDAVRFVTSNGGERVIGDLPVKRCRRNWLLFSTGCTYPDHPRPYAGRRLGNAFLFFAI